ncbi:MAG: hypothetical protein ACPL07_00725 [Candidatus Bathyarchaeia archaeon]
MAKKNIAITTDNLAISFNPSGKPNVTILGDYFKASKEIADLIGKLFLKDQAKALSLEEAFYSIKSKDETYLFKVADFLQKQYEAISPMRALFDDAWGKAEEQAVYKLANQLENVFSIYSAKGELKTFSEFADEIKALYKGLAFKAKEIAVQELKAINPKQAEEFERAFEKLENKRRNRGLFVGLGIMVTLLSAAIGGYFYMKHQEEQAKEPYKQAGLTDEQAEQFISKYHSQNGNSTWVSFAQAWVKDKALADKSFDAFKDLKSSLGYIYFVSSNGYDGLSFLKDFPQLKDNYQAILPAYSKNSSLVRIVFDQFQRDEKISDKKALFLEALKAYEELGREVQKFSQIYAINNATSYFGSSAKLKEEIGSEALLAALRKLGENDEINKDFDNTAKHAHLLRLAKHVQNILKYPKEWREGAIQIDDIGYKINPVSGIALATQNESKFWNIVEKAVKYTVDKLDSGEAAYYLDIPDAKLEAWYRRVRLLPRELFTIDIVSGDWRAPNLDFGEKKMFRPTQELEEKFLNIGLKKWLKKISERKPLDTNWL